MKPTRRRASLFAAMLVLVAAGSIGVASANWAGSGSGAGSATTGTTLPVTLSSRSSSGQLFPGGQGDVTLTISNPNLAIVRIGSLVLDLGQGIGGFAVDASHSGCATSALSFTTQTNGGTGWNVPARAGAVDGSLAVTLPNALAMGSAAANACQGATFTVYLIAGL